MSTSAQISSFLNALRSENIKTWFDLGLFIDRLKESRKVPPLTINTSIDDFRKIVTSGGIGFLTFQYSIDGEKLPDI